MKAPTYQDLTRNPEMACKIIKGSCVTGTDPLKSWEEGRKFIASLLTHSGTILDIGCVNGFLLKSFQEWSEHELVPYGIDDKEDHIAEARKLFPLHTENFIVQKFTDFSKEYPTSFPFPEQFDFIYWAVWTNINVKRVQITTLLEHVADGGRLILGFYPDTNTSPCDVKNNIGNLKDMGLEFEVVENFICPERDNKVIFFDK